MSKSNASDFRGLRSVDVIVDGNAKPRLADFGLYRDVLKRFFDLAFVLAVLPIILPALGVLYLVVRRDGGPFLFRHERIGIGGETFHCLKVRTMVDGAEAVLKELLEHSPEARAEWNSTYKLRNDPRITRVGRVLRKTSLDELPQLLNVLMGQMSVVGPRPMTAEELDRYGAAEYYTRVRPGLTGPWQVTGRRDNDIKSRVALDIQYVRNVNFLSDSYYLLATVPEVIFCRGR